MRFGNQVCACITNIGIECFCSKFALSKSEKVVIEVFNSLGQRITTLCDKQMPRGFHEVVFNAINLQSGVYIYKIIAGQFQEVKKMLYLK